MPAATAPMSSRSSRTRRPRRRLLLVRVPATPMRRSGCRARCRAPASMRSISSWKRLSWRLHPPLHLELVLERGDEVLLCAGCALRPDLLQPLGTTDVRGGLAQALLQELGALGAVCSIVSTSLSTSADTSAYGRSGALDRLVDARTPDRSNEGAAPRRKRADVVGEPRRRRRPASDRISRYPGRSRRAPRRPPGTPRAPAARQGRARRRSAPAMTISAAARPNADRVGERAR